MAKKKKAPAASCKTFARPNGKRGKICHDGKGKIVSAAKVAKLRGRKAA